jgi:tetratricopeptide (TPR) repeat protein
MYLSIEQALQQAVETHKAGKLQGAEALYRAILKAQPKHPDANHNLGVLAVSLNKTEAALPLFKIALEANPDQGQFWLSYLDSLIKEKQFDNARNVLEQVKRRGLIGEKVDLLEAQLVQLDINFKNQKTETNKLSKAIELREMGRYQEAQDWLNKFLEIEPTDAEGWSLLSQLFLLDKKDAQAEKAIATAILINPILPSIYRNQARLLLKNAKPAEALLKAQSGFEKSTEDPESWIVLAACLGANQRDLEALPLIDRALKAIPNYAEAFANRGLVRLRAKNTSGAIEDFEKAVDLKPHLTQIWEVLGALRYQNWNLPDAIEALKKAQALEPDNVNRMINLGEFLRQAKRIEEAIAILEDAAEKAPENTNTWINLGVVYQQDNKFEKAQVAYKKALVINPNLAEVYNNLGSIAKDTKDWESALKYFEQAITFKPDLAQAHSNLGNTLKELGKLEDAEASYSKAIAIKPDLAEAHSNLGNTLKDLGRLEDAEASYSKAIAIMPDLAEAHNNLGIILQDLGRLEDAEASYKKAIAIKPALAEAHYNLGVTLQEFGRFAEAEATYVQAIRLKPDFIKARTNMLNCLYLMDKKSLFCDELDFLIRKDIANSIVGSFTFRSALRYGEGKKNIFCNDPLNHVLLIDLKSRYNFEEIFVRKVRSILHENKRSNKRQTNLLNGYQTSGNLFDIGNRFTDEIQKIVRAEIENYRINFADSQEGLIKKWPIEYSLYGWLISMKSGGELLPHMHETGWLTGSIYINIPPKSKIDSGSLVVALGKDSDTTNSRQNSKKIIDVVTGSLALFPASLMHHTIPFESEEERIVLAFDVIPKY